MELLGIFHRRSHMEARGVCDAPYAEKGTHALAAEVMASEGGLLACAQGRIRNAAALAALETQRSQAAEAMTAAAKAHEAEWCAALVQRTLGGEAAQ